MLRSPLLGVRSVGVPVSRSTDGMEHHAPYAVRSSERPRCTLVAVERDRNAGKTGCTDLARQIHRDLALEGEMLLACAAPEFVRPDPQRTRDLLDQQFELFGGQFGLLSGQSAPRGFLNTPDLKQRCLRVPQQLGDGKQPADVALDRGVVRVKSCGAHAAISAVTQTD